MKYLLGLDIGSSFIKAALLDAASGKALASAFSPPREMQIHTPQPGFAEQDPELWWRELGQAVQQLKMLFPFDPTDIMALGISYQMHGLVCVDRELKAIRPAIIWCDGRAVEIGNRAFQDLGEDFCLQHFLNSPGNFTASKLRWVQQHEPGVYNRIFRVLLPGDYIALRLTGEATTTVCGLSEGIFWDYPGNGPARDLLSYYQIDQKLLAPLTPTFGNQGKLSQAAAQSLGLASGTPLCYRAGDQPNNAYSLQVLEPGEVAATAGTSAVIYGVTNKPSFDLQSRVNSFVHVNSSKTTPRLGVLLCVNGAGILNSWLKQNFFSGFSYSDINIAAASVPIGAQGLLCFPFGNGAERILANRDLSARLQGLQFNLHRREHVARAAQEGIVFALNYGAEIMRDMGLVLHTVRAGYANMFLSEVFCSTFANATGCRVELYNTDGALGAARAAGVGLGYYSDLRQSFRGMECIRRIEPEPGLRGQTQDAYLRWKKELLDIIH
jgi:xylulokinase